MQGGSARRHRGAALDRHLAPLSADAAALSADLPAHALMLILGGYDTSARVPLGFWFADLFDLSRNHYDRLGHLAQGFIPAILAREIPKRRSPLGQSRWLSFSVVCVCLGFQRVLRTH